MSAKLDQPYEPVLGMSRRDFAAEVPPPVDYHGSQSPEYDRCVSALFFAPYAPGHASYCRQEPLRVQTRRIRPDWNDSVWDAELRWKNC